MPDCTPRENEAYQHYMDRCLQETLADLPDMGARRANCQQQWDAAHPPAPDEDATEGQPGEGGSEEDTRVPGDDAPPAQGAPEGQLTETFE